MTRRLLAALLGLMPAMTPLPLAAQGLAQLVADSVTVTAQEVLVARGNVEAFYDGTRLSASAITYDRAADRLTVAGPILITTPDGEVFTAEAAEIDPRLEAGLLRGARLVLDRQLQVSAARIDRTGTGLTALTRTAATSCRVCGDETPLWEIRAARVVHDEIGQQLYFDDASFRVAGVPVFWLPRMRLPDPTLERASGLLVPQLFSSDALGFGLKLPYFIRLGGRRDLTVTPWIATGARNLELRYRQAFRSGWTQIETHLAEDDGAVSLRYALFAEGAFALPRDIRLEFDLEAVSDEAFLLDYDLSDQDRLDSSLRAYRLRDDGYALAEIAYYESLREDESSASLPPLVARIEREAVLRPAPLGGRLRLRADADALWRDGDPGDPEATRDVTRGGVSGDWYGDLIFGPGLQFTTELRGRLDAYAIDDDPEFDDTVLRAAQSAGVTLRWPLLRRGDDGTAQIIEPVASLAGVATQGGDVPNEDSRLAEFDAASLFALDRLPGEDLQETGLNAGLGLRWSLLGADGRSLSVLGGRLLRDEALQGIDDITGLTSTRSDWLISTRLDLGQDLGLEASTTFDDDFGISTAEARLGFDRESFDFTAAYLWLEEGPAEDQPRISEIAFDTVLNLGPRWSLSAEARYDIAADEPVRAEIGAGWRNECVTVDLSASRRYTDTDDVDPSTSFGLSVNLAGFSTGQTALPAARSCEG
ncbi:LPS-assembly protein LptD [Limimaricola sp. AA108-03]|uniref:LPS-assembly protein LptD n=1 Tax=Limimaricola sp. AA108-03 TaxID=3425945 RepID=UPI003D772411